MVANGRSQLEGVVQRNGGASTGCLAVMRQQTASASARDQCLFELVEPWAETTWRARGSFRRARVGPIHHAAWDAYVRATVTGW